jgi:hypothetical protein
LIKLLTLNHSSYLNAKFSFVFVSIASSKILFFTKFLSFVNVDKLKIAFHWKKHSFQKILISNSLYKFEATKIINRNLKKFRISKESLEIEIIKKYFRYNTWETVPYLGNSVSCLKCGFELGLRKKHSQEYASNSLKSWSSFVASPNCYKCNACGKSFSGYS